MRFMLFAYLFVHSVAFSQSPESLHEVLPIHHPTDGNKTVLLSYTNPHDKRVVIDSYSAACACSRDVKIPTSRVEAGETISFELNFLVPNRPQESLRLDFTISGHLADSKEKDHSRLLAKYHLEVPVYDQIGMLRKHDFLAVVGEGKCAITILNSSAIKWAEIQARVAEFPELIANCSFSTTRFGKNDYQTVCIEFEGFKKLLAESKKPEKITLTIFARAENQVSFESTKGLDIPIKWLSEIEHFPKKFSIDNGIESIDVNIVGRGIALTDLSDEISVVLGEKKLDKTEFRVSQLSPKWLRVAIDRAVIRKDPNLKELFVELPSRGWRLAVAIESSQPQETKSNAK
jgi:hypothetical protein